MVTQGAGGAAAHVIFADAAGAGVVGTTQLRQLQLALVPPGALERGVAGFVHARHHRVAGAIQTGGLAQAVAPRIGADPDAARGRHVATESAGTLRIRQARAPLHLGAIADDIALQAATAPTGAKDGIEAADTAGVAGLAWTFTGGLTADIVGAKAGLAIAAVDPNAALAADVSLLAE